MPGFKPRELKSGLTSAIGLGDVARPCSPGALRPAALRRITGAGSGIIRAGK